MRRTVAIALLFVSSGAVAAGTPVEFSLTVSPMAGTQTDDYIATMQTVIHGVNGAERLWPPDFGDFQVIDQRRQQSTQWSYDPRRGQEIANVEVRRFFLKPTRAGKLKIGEARLRVDGVEYKTQPVVVEVASAGTTPQAQAQEPDDAQLSQIAPGYKPPAPEQLSQVFLHAVVDKPKVMQGEQATVTWLLFTRSEVLKFEPKPPKLDGFWAETLYEPQQYFQYHDTMVLGRQYAVAVVSRRALFPVKPGKLVIPKFEADVTTLYQSFGASRLASPELTVDAQPLPPGAPAAFDPAWVGKFTATATVDRDQIPGGESLTLALTVQGQGAIRRTRVPALSFDNIQVIPPRDCDEKVEAPADVLRGEHKCLYILTPTKGGKLAVGPIELPYFDPQTGKYETAHVDPIPINVVGDPAALVGKTGGGGGVSSENVIDKQIRPPREEPNVSSRIVARFYHSKAFLGALGAPPILFVLVVLGDKLLERLRRETPRARLRRARGRARKRLRLAELHIRGGRAGKFFGEVQKVLVEHIEERVGEPVSAMTRDQLRAFLPSRGFPDETVEALVRELENADFARFAPSASGPGEMRAALRRVRALLTAIERVRPTTKSDGEEAAA